MINLNKIFDDSFQEWMAAIDDTRQSNKSNALAHVETVIKNYHIALKKELEKQNIHI